jgi:hypothetical protein
MAGSNIKSSQERNPCSLEVVDKLRPLNGGLQKISEKTEIVNTTDKVEGGKSPITKGI